MNGYVADASPSQSQLCEPVGIERFHGHARIERPRPQGTSGIYIRERKRDDEREPAGECVVDIRAQVSASSCSRSPELHAETAKLKRLVETVDVNCSQA